MSGFSTELLIGAAETLHAAGVGVWRPDSDYQTGEVAIVLGPAPQTPDRVIALDTYPVSDAFAHADSVLGVQVRTRGSRDVPTSASDLDDAVFDVLQGQWAAPFGAVHVVSLSRRSGVSLGTDESRRPQRSSNYYAHVHRPSPHRT